MGDTLAVEETEDSVYRNTVATVTQRNPCAICMSVNAPRTILVVTVRLPRNPCIFHATLASLENRCVSTVAEVQEGPRWVPLVCPVEKEPMRTILLKFHVLWISAYHCPQNKFPVRKCMKSRVEEAVAVAVVRGRTEGPKVDGEETGM